MINVLIADDEPRICELINNLVSWEDFGMRIAGTVYDGAEALLFISGNPVDLLVTDIRMPGLGGLDLIREIKSICPDMCFIIVSGYDDFKYAQEALRLGVIDFLQKPLLEDELVAALLKVKSIFEKSGGAGLSAGIVHATGEAPPPPVNNTDAPGTSSSFTNTHGDDNPQGHEPGGDDILERRLIKEAKQYIKEHISGQIKLRDVCARSGLNESYFSSVFKKETGVNFSKYLIFIRIETAKELLRDSPENIQTIAELVGYLDLKTFNKNFTSLTGFKPSEYRRLYGLR